MKATIKQLALFIAVGCAAAVVHLSVVVVLVEHARIHPLLANCAGWAVAFGVSFTGHHRWTFKREAPSAAARQQAARRYLLLSATGFAINQSAYALALHWTVVRYDWLLTGVLVGVAVATYLLSRWWAFQDTPDR